MDTPWLPPEILRIIFFVHPRSIPTVRLVCHAWNDALSDIAEGLALIREAPPLSRTFNPCEQAAYVGSLSLLKFAHKHAKWSLGDSVNRACRFGHLHVVRWVVKHGGVASPYSLYNAIMSKNKELIDYLVEDLGLQVSTEALSFA